MTAPPPSAPPASAPAEGVWRPGVDAPYYVALGREVELFAECHARALPVMLKGPTGCGKTRFVEHMAWRLGRPLVTVACHDDLAAGDLTGRWLVRGGETVWVDGPLATAARLGAICYLDEVVEARQDTIVVLHPLTDDRRVLPVEKTGELVRAAPASSSSSRTTPATSTRSRISSRARGSASSRSSSTTRRRTSRRRSSPTRAASRRARRRRSSSSRGACRRLREEGLPEGPGTRTVVAAARLIAGGIAPADACRAAMAAPLTEDAELLTAIGDLVEASL
jgi:nitric oxide reductase NorQ protein